MTLTITLSVAQDKYEETVKECTKALELKNENFPKITVLKKIILKYNLLMKNSEGIHIYLQILLLSEFLYHKPKSTVFL